MPIYISQGRYALNAVKGMMAKPEDRSKAVAKLMKDAGGKLLSYYLTFGEYDFIVIAEAPNESAMASVLLAAISGGGVTDVRTTVALTPAEAMKAFENASQLAASFKSAGQAGAAQLEGAGGRRGRAAAAA
jgi:uncharacterized protein with GYD domain